VYARAGIGESVGVGDGPTAEALLPLVPVWDDLALPNGGTADVSGPEGTELFDVSFSAIAADPPPPDGDAFPHGRLSFRALAVSPGQTARITVDLPSVVTRYYTLLSDRSGWSDFSWDGTTGAEFGPGNRVTLTIRDGGRGDDDGQADGTIVASGAPATAVP
jgi:hypothetical protein